MIRRSLEEVGGGRSILVDGDNIIRAGNGVYEQAQELGMEVVVVEAKPNQLIAVKRSDLTGVAAERAALYDNQASETSEWSPEFFQSADQELLAGIFSEDEINSLRKLSPNEVVRKDGDDEDTYAAEVESVPAVCSNGDLLVVNGRHRVLIGSATNPKDVETLFGVQRAAITFTSPPYNLSAASPVLTSLQMKGSESRYVAGTKDDLSQEQYLDLLSNSLHLAMQYSQYCFYNVQMLAGNKLALVDWLHQNKEQLADILIWNKLNAQPAMSHRVTNSQFEMVFIFSFVFSQDGKRTIGTKEFWGTVPNVYSAGKQTQNDYAGVHGASFPLHLPMHYIDNFCNPGELVYDPFLGTGTTLVAAERLQRICYGMELEPRYGDLIVDRCKHEGYEVEISNQKAVRGPKPTVSRK